MAMLLMQRQIHTYTCIPVKKLLALKCEIQMYEEDISFEVKRIRVELVYLSWSCNSAVNCKIRDLIRYCWDLQ